MDITALSFRLSMSKTLTLYKGETFKKFQKIFQKKNFQKKFSKKNFKKNFQKKNFKKIFQKKKILKKFSKKNFKKSYINYYIPVKLSILIYIFNRYYLVRYSYDLRKY